jgi:hypothetical protein
MGYQILTNSGLLFPPLVVVAPHTQGKAQGQLLLPVGQPLAFSA